MATRLPEIVANLRTLNLLLNPKRAAFREAQTASLPAPCLLYQWSSLTTIWHRPLGLCTGLICSCIRRDTKVGLSQNGRGDEGAGQMQAVD